MSELAPAYVLPSFDIALTSFCYDNFQAAGRQTTRHSEDTGNALLISGSTGACSGESVSKAKHWMRWAFPFIPLASLSPNL